MKILITGSSGFLGQYLNLELSKHHDILTLYHQTPRNCGQFNSQQIDIRDYEKLKYIFESFKPDVVVHTASISTPQKAEALPTKIVYETNVIATKNIAQLCAQYSSKLIYTSTDLVYAGYRGSYLKEDAKLIPLSLYAETKLMGEEKIRSTFDNYIILKTALMFGFGLNGSSCFFHQMYDKLKAGQKVKVFYDQFRSPLSVLEASRIINHLCVADIKGEIINFGGRERLSRYEFGLKVCKYVGFDESLLEKISMFDLPNLPHVADVSMNIEKLQSFRVTMKSTEEVIKEIICK
ncbi:MAG: NAD(P)-dependent oxidoreductase [Ignavibacteria bacterium RBG_16_35_7]|nr:MAG: NAD(P)-dependent oxidoreductase [Ignavibacteria bacterium RBG_16_35_7]